MWGREPYPHENRLQAVPPGVFGNPGRRVEREGNHGRTAMKGGLQTDRDLDCQSKIQAGCDPIQIQGIGLDQFITGTRSMADFCNGYKSVCVDGSEGPENVTGDTSRAFAPSIDRRIQGKFTMRILTPLSPLPRISQTEGKENHENRPFS